MVTIPPTNLSQLPSTSQPSRHSPLPSLNPNRHIDLPKRVLTHKVRVPLIRALHQRLAVLLARTREQQELDARRRLEDGEFEERRFEDFDPGRWDGGVGRRIDLFDVVDAVCRAWAGGGGRGCDGNAGREGARDGVHAVEGAGQDEEVVGAYVAA